MQVRTCVPVFRISGIAGRIVSKLGMRLWEPLYVDMCFTQDGDIRTGARVTVHTLKHICSPSLVHRPKSALLVT